MIDVKYIFDRVNKDLAQKNHSGYNSVSEFNNNLRDSENMLYQFYLKQFETSQLIADALDPFVKESKFSIVSGYVTKPLKFRHPIDLRYP